MSATVGAVLVAAGSSRRMGFDKIWAPLAGRAVLEYSLEGLLGSGVLDRVALVVSPYRLESAADLARGCPKVVVCVGGARRRDSVAAGLAALSDLEWIVVHDAARPFLTSELIHDGLAAAAATDAAVAGVPCRDTVKRVRSGIVLETPPREELWSVQTPQVFRRQLLQRALESSDADVTDEATLIEQLAVPVAVYLGSASNLKLTTPEDLRLAEALLAARERDAVGR